MDNKPNTIKQLSHPNLMPSRVYKFRVLGITLGGIPNAVVLIELNANFEYWVWWFFSIILWPHIAYFVAIKNKNPYIIERNNLLFDSFIAGTWASFLHFNLLPSVLLIAISLSDKVSSGIKNLWLFSMPSIAIGILIAALFTGFAFQPITSTNVILACLPILIIHTFLVAIGGYQLVRKVQFQNKSYKELSQKDVLTPLLNRRAWQTQVEKQLDNQNTPISLLLVNINDLKQINNQFGHAMGDKVVVAIAEIISDITGQNSICGRIDGAKFAIVLMDNLPQVKLIANSIENQVENYEFKNSNIYFSVSFGISEVIDNTTNFDTLLNCANRDLS